MPAKPKLVPGQVIEVPIDLLKPDPDQPRTEFDEDRLAELAADIKTRGIEQPIRVRADFTIKHGERRWRAAKLAKLARVPVLLAEDHADEKHGALERYLDQVADNHHQTPLSQMDMARFLKKLTTEHGVKVADVPELLAKRGITMSRAYVSNTMRLLDLPEWAQQLIAAGEIPPGHGKYILMAKPSTAAMKALEKLVKDRLKWNAETGGGRLSTYDIEYFVAQAFGESHPCLTRTWGKDKPLFDVVKECRACKDRHRVGDADYCLNRPCFDEKQAAAAARRESATSEKAKAKPKQPPKPFEPKVNADGIVHLGRIKSERYEYLDAANVKFHPAVHCEGCPHKKLGAYNGRKENARPVCFNPAHFAELQRGGSREEAVAKWLDKRVFEALEQMVAKDDRLQMQLVAWMAVGAPTQNDAERDVREQLLSEQHYMRRRVNLRNLGAVVEACDASALPTDAIAIAGLKALMRDRGHFYAFARYAGLKLTPELAGPDREYIEIKRKAELIELARRHGLVTNEEDLLPLQQKKLEELRAFCLTEQSVARIGVPYDVAALYEMEPIIDLYHDNGDAVLDDEDVPPPLDELADGPDHEPEDAGIPQPIEEGQ